MTGVLSTKSTPERYKKPFSTSTETILQTLRPIGFGRCGDRVEKTPTLK